MINNELLKNKAADSRMLSPWLFFVLGLIGVAIAVGVFSYFSGSADMRVMEAKTLSDRLVFAIAEDGYLKEGVVLGGFDIFANSYIDEKSLDNQGKLYFNITIYNEEGNLEKSFVRGNADFEIQCRLSGSKLAKCFYREFNLVDTTGTKLYKIKIFTGSNN